MTALSASIARRLITDLAFNSLPISKGRVINDFRRNWTGVYTELLLLWETYFIFNVMLSMQQNTV